MTHCDLCGTQSDRLTQVDDLWGLGVEALCEDPAECASAWGEGFGVDPNETAALTFSLILTDDDKAMPR
jgi:hypothetical protein